MTSAQAGILSGIPSRSRFLTFSLRSGESPARNLLALRQQVDGQQIVAGLGQSTIHALGSEIRGLRDFPVYSGPGFEVPSTPAALWFWLRGEDAGELYLRSEEIVRSLAPVYRLDNCLDAFRHGDDRDLTGYPLRPASAMHGDSSRLALVDDEAGPGMTASCFVAVQQWQHELSAFQDLSQAEQDEIFGRRIVDLASPGTMPDSAHGRRVQTNDEAAAGILRRAMPWTDARRAGLMYLAFCGALQPYERLLRRMTGNDDGITDALFRFTRPLTGQYFWCPPMHRSQLDLSALGLH